MISHHIIKTLVGAFLFCLFTTNMSGQGLLNRVIKQSKRKIEKKASDLIVEKASEAIANKVYSSMSDAFDKMMTDAMKEDSAYQANHGDSLAYKYGKLADTWMSRMNEAADVPPQYAFTHKILVETQDHKSTNEFTLYLNKDQPLFAMAQKEDDGHRIMLMDLKKDVTVMYTDDESGKKAQAIPNLMAMGGNLARAHIDTSKHDFSFKKTGKSKKILGYHAEEFEGESDEYQTTFYITKELDVDWRNAFGGMMEKFSGTRYQEDMKELQGFMLESHSQSLKRKKDTSSWITKEIDREPFTINNADYKFGDLYSQ